MDSRIPRPRHIVIIGGGVIGTTSAYYLTRHPSFNPSIHHITLLEATGIAAGASGKAGGLIGRWAYPTCLVPLSYALHAELASEHDGASRWGYRRVECGQIAATVRNKHLNGQATTPAKVKQEKRDRSSTSSTPSRQSQPTNGHDTPNQGHEWTRLPKQNAAAKLLLHKSALPPDLDWINGELVREYAEMGLPGYTETAQVHPLHFTTAIAELARKGGTEIRINTKVTKINLNTVSKAVTSVEYLDRTTNETRTILGVTDVVVAAGPWTGRLVPSTKVEGLRIHSVVFNANVSPFAVFTNISLPPGWAPAHRAALGQKRLHRGNVDPEIYARPGSEVYACGEPDYSKLPLPDLADQCECDDLQCDDLIAYIGTVSPVLGAAPIAAKQACYIPQHIREESLPLVGPTSVPGLWIASGHTCWGIQNGPATGKLISEFLFDGEAKSADIADLDPRTFGV
ncbi:FAD dependent oxidoreductase [Xylariomycetidae sp. FL2044]|nr:FAD dependent oxidoreductase [Xylariomycetidae sp. FL2044]